MGIFICELAFEAPDSQNPRYSHHEVDYYAHVPYLSQQKYGVESHRLSLRKNLAKNTFEVYRHHPFHCYLGKEEDKVAFTGTLNEAVKYAEREWNKFWGHLGGKREPDQICEHKYPKISVFCPKAR